MNDTAEKLEENIEDSNQAVEQDDFEVEVVDDRPEEDRVAKRNESVEAKPDDENEDEVRNYSQNAQKRISQLKYEYHEERRAKEEAARLREEALKYAETLKKLRKKVNYFAFCVESCGESNIAIYNIVYIHAIIHNITNSQMSLKLARKVPACIKIYIYYYLHTCVHAYIIIYSPACLLACMKYSLLTCLYQRAYFIVVMYNSRPL